MLKSPNTAAPAKKKKKLEQKINDSKVRIWSLSINFRFSGRKSQSQQKLAKRITHFTMQFPSENPTYFTNFDTVNIMKNLLPQHSQKSFSLYKFSTKHVSGWYQKIFLRYIISRRPKTSSRSPWKLNICIFL